MKIYDSLTRETRGFVPIVAGHATIYVCGRTVAIFMVDASLNQVEIATPPLWHIDAVLGGGVHPIAYEGVIVRAD